MSHILRKSKLYLLVSCLILLTGSLGLAQAELQEGIILSTGENTGVYPTLSFFDMTSGTLTTWHTPPSEDTVVSIPHNWSPDGKLLAVFSYYAGIDPYIDGTQMCLVDRRGRVVQCMIEPPPQFVNFQATWSADSQKLYYLAGREFETDTTRLVEADVNTGEILRTLYSYTRDDTFDYSIKYVIWSSSLDTLGINFIQWQSTLEEGLRLIDLNSGQETFLSAQLLNRENQESLDCSIVFPDEKIFALLNYDSLSVFDTTGHLLGAIKVSDLYPIQERFTNGQVSCPTMLPSGEDLLFYAHPRMYRYNIKNQLIEPLFELPSEWRIHFLELKLSPDKERILMRGHIRDHVIVIITDFDGNYIEVSFSSIGFFADYPVWIPELH
jgi:hypothetical protein